MNAQSRPSRTPTDAPLHLMVHRPTWLPSVDVSSRSMVHYKRVNTVSMSATTNEAYESVLGTPFQDRLGGEVRGLDLSAAHWLAADADPELDSLLDEGAQVLRHHCL